MTSRASPGTTTLYDQRGLSRDRENAQLRPRLCSPPRLLPLPARYIGFIGPRARREQLLGDLSTPACRRRISSRPPAFDLGERGPEEIALAVVARSKPCLAPVPGKLPRPQISHPRTAIPDGCELPQWSEPRKSIGAIILAACRSSRLGRPKQFLRYRGETLIRRAAIAALAAGCSPVVVVAGAAHERIARELSELEVQLHHHAQWPRGIGSSVRAGLERALLLAPSLEAVVLMVCDQPHVSAEVLTALIGARAETQQPGRRLRLLRHSGVPALFARSLFPRLATLPDNQGAKHLLQALQDQITRLPFPHGSIDIDTPADARHHLERSDEHRLATFRALPHRAEPFLGRVGPSRLASPCSEGDRCNFSFHVCRPAPAGEALLDIPYGLAVAKEDEGGHCATFTIRRSHSVPPAALRSGFLQNQTRHPPMSRQ